MLRSPKPPRDHRRRRRDGDRRHPGPLSPRAPESRRRKEAEEKHAEGGLLQSIGDFFRGFGTVLQSRPFLLLCAATLLLFNGFILTASFQFYVIIYYVLGGDQALGAE